MFQVSGHWPELRLPCSCSSIPQRASLLLFILSQEISWSVNSYYYTEILALKVEIEGGFLVGGRVVGLTGDAESRSRKTKLLHKFCVTGT